LQSAGLVTRVAATVITLACWIGAFAPLRATEPSAGSSPHLLLVNRFIQNDRDRVHQYRAFRRLEATNEKFKKDAWLEAWTELTPRGLTYEIVDGGGSEYIRSKALEAALKNEQRLLAAGGIERADLTTANYEFGAAEPSTDGLIRVGLKARRADQVLVNGAMFLSPRSGDLLRVEGALAKAPSFWTRRVEIVREYRRVAGIRVPVRVESLVQVKIAGDSRFVMTYDYERINDQVVGAPGAVANRRR
jgi:hypothetical protein